MAIDTYAAGDDRVQIRLGDDTVRICSSYDVKSGVFEQPSTFSVRLGDGSLSASLIQRFPVNTPFQILIGGKPQFSGYTEGRESQGSATQGSELDIHGRSILSKLLTDIEAEQSFNAKTHRELVEKALTDLQIVKPFTSGRPSVLGSNADARKARSGTDVESFAIDEWNDILAQPAGNNGDAFPVLRAKLAEKYLDLIRKHLDTVGMFPWDSPTGDIVIGRPNWKQPAIARLVRRLGRVPTSTIESHRYREDFAHRFSEVVIYGKTTGHKYSRHTTSGAYTDDGIVALGIHRVKVLRDVQVTSIAHAEAIAKKHIAEGRRKAFTLEYTVRGHSTDNVLTGGRTVWAPDTCVDVIDDELGLSATYYLESCRYTRSGRGTQTHLKLLELDTLIFGTDERPPGPPGPPPSAAQQIAAFEAQYGITSAVMKSLVASGSLPETPDVKTWLTLLGQV